MILDTILQKLSHLDSYEDTRKTRKIMSDIVMMARQTEDDQMNTDLWKLEKIWNIMYQTEYQLEKKLWNQIIQACNPWDTLQRFIYYHNYELLTQKELEALFSEAGHVDHLLFVGGGPVPLSAILIAHQHMIHTTIIDSNLEAVEISRKVVKALGLDNMITIEYADVCTYCASRQYDAVIIAAMVFTYSNHEKVIRNLKVLAAPKNHILKRTTAGIRQLFYKPIDLTAIAPHFSIKKEFHPTGDSQLINSFYLSTINK